MIDKIDKKLFVECLNIDREKSGLGNITINNISQLLINNNLIIYSIDFRRLDKFPLDLYIQYIRNRKIDLIIEI